MRLEPVRREGQRDRLAVVKRNRNLLQCGNPIPGFAVIINCLKHLARRAVRVRLDKHAKRRVGRRAGTDFRQFADKTVVQFEPELPPVILQPNLPDLDGGGVGLVRFADGQRRQLRAADAAKEDIADFAAQQRDGLGMVIVVDTDGLLLRRGHLAAVHREGSLIRQNVHAMRRAFQRTRVQRERTADGSLSHMGGPIVHINGIPSIADNAPGLRRARVVDCQMPRDRQRLARLAGAQRLAVQVQRQRPVCGNRDALRHVREQLNGFAVLRRRKGGLQRLVADGANRGDRLRGDIIHRLPVDILRAKFQVRRQKLSCRVVRKPKDIFGCRLNVEDNRPRCNRIDRPRNRAAVHRDSRNIQLVAVVIHLDARDAHAIRSPVCRADYDRGLAFSPKAVCRLDDTRVHNTRGN